MDTDNDIESARKFLTGGDWRQWGELCRDRESAMIETRDFDGFLRFHDAGLRFATTPEQFEQIQIRDIGRFRKGFGRCLSRGLKKARSQAAIRALYFEYFYDGGDASDGNLFLCQAFDVDDEEWAAEFAEDGVIPGPSILPWLHYDPELEFPEDVRKVADVYVDAHLLVACLREIEAMGGIEYPFGFARHDGPIALKLPDRG